MTDDGRVSRRGALRALGASGIAGLAGCSLPGDGETDGNEVGRAEDGTSTGATTGDGTANSVDTIVVTDAPTDEDTDRSTDGSTTTDDGDGPADGSTTAADTAGDLTFDGGGAQAFADALDALADHPTATLEIEPGTYELDPTDVVAPDANYAFDVAGLDRNWIDGNGATLAFTDPTYGMFAFRGGRDLLVRNLTLDYRPPPYTQGTVVALDSGAGTLTLALDDGYPRPDGETFERNPRHYATVHTADGEYVRGIRGRANDGVKRFSSVERVGDRRYEFVLSEYSHPTGLAEGRKLAYLARGGGGHPIALGDVARPRIENVTVRASMSWVIFGWNCDGPRVDGVTIAPADGSDRLIASNSDGVHFVNCRNGPVVENCHVENVNDDAIVVNAIMAPVTGVDGATVELAERYYFDAAPGDDVEAMTPDGTRSGVLPDVAAVERGRFDAPAALTLESPVDDRVSAGDHLLNYAVANRGYEVKENTVRNDRARLIRLTSGDGEVHDNDLEGSSLAPILLESSAGETEPTGWVEDVTILGNRIARAGLNHMAGDRADGVYVTHRSPPGVGTGGRPHRDVVVGGNEFAGAANRGVYAADVAGLEVVDNAFADLNRLPYDRFRDAAGYAMAFENAADVTVSSNDVTGTSQRLAELGWRRDSENVTVRNNELTVDGGSRQPRLLRDD